MDFITAILRFFGFYQPSPTPWDYQPIRKLTLPPPIDQKQSKQICILPPPPPKPPEQVQLHRLRSSASAPPVQSVTKQHDAATIKARRLDVRKALSQCEFIARSYNRALWARPTDRANWEADLLTMHLFDDLARVTLQLLDHTNMVVFEFRVHFGTNSLGRSLVDSAAGVELPILTLGSVVGHQLLVRWHGKDQAAYRPLLKLKWNTAHVHQSRTTEQFESDHAGKISAGRQRAYFSVAGVRHRLSVVQVCCNGEYAFGRDTELGAEVYLHSKFAPAGFTFSVGQMLTAIIVQTPRGPQARNIAKV